MPVATFESYCRMLDAAAAGGFAYPAINVSSSQTLNAALAGFVRAGSDGIVQVSFGSAAYVAGPVGEMATGALGIAELAAVVAADVPVTVALHTDHCPPDHLETFLLPLLAHAERRVAAGRAPAFQSHMFDGSTLPLAENLDRSVALLERCRGLGVLLEVEVGAVGGEEDGRSVAIDDRLYTSAEDIAGVVERLDAVGGRYLLAAAFGNVHGVHPPGNVQLRPEILRAGQALVRSRSPDRGPVDLVFHGGSGTPDGIVAEAIGYGVVKVNLDTEAQYAFTRAVADHVFHRFDEVLALDGHPGTKAAYDPRAWGRSAEAAMASFVESACRRLGSAGRAVA